MEKFLFLPRATTELGSTLAGGGQTDWGVVSSLWFRISNYDIQARNLITKFVFV